MLGKDQAIGIMLLVAGVLGIIVYGWFVFLTEWSMVVLQLTGFIAVATILAIVSWIGYTLATTPPPKPIEEIEKEIEGDLKKTEETSVAEGEKTGGEEEQKE
ncbi:MAG: transcriptional regulator [Candidatus Bathyarchaeia archaeon]